MEAEEILEYIETSNTKVEELRATLPEVKKIALHTGLSGFNDPGSFGVYKSNGGDCLGVSKGSYTPVNLSMFLDVIVNSINESGVDLDVDKMEYREYRGGKKITFSVPLKKYEIASPMVGDALESKLLFTSGFDCLTKSSLSFSTLRLWCANGAKSWKNDYALSFKNTKNNVDKYMLFTEQIIKTVTDVEDYVKFLGDLSQKTVTKDQLDNFYMAMFGINRTNYHDSHKKSQNIFDKINEAVAIEEANTGMNLFSLLNGITRYTSHELAEVEEDLYFGNAATINQQAHQLIYSLS